MPKNSNTKNTTSNSEVVDNFVKGLTGSRKDNIYKKMVGVNGFAVGETFTCTGELGIEPIQNSDATYLAIKTKEGRAISLQSVMGVSNLSGYTTKGTLISECFGTNEDGNVDEDVIVENKVECTAEISAKDFQTKVFQPETRNFIDFANLVAQGGIFDEGTKLTYLGKIGRPYIARKHSLDFGEQYKAGMKRVITANLWSVEK